MIIFAIILNSGSLKLNLAKKPTQNNAKKVDKAKQVIPIKAKAGELKLLAIPKAPYSIPQGKKPKIIPSKYPLNPNELVSKLLILPINFWYKLKKPKYFFRNNNLFGKI